MAEIIGNSSGGCLKKFFAIFCTFLTLPLFAFSSVKWLAERNDDSDMVRLRTAFAECTAKVSQPAEDVMFPIEHFPDGTVKSRIRAKRAQMFLDTGFIWGEGIRVEEYDANGKMKSSLTADNCVVDRNTRAGWVEGAAVMSMGDTVVKGRGVYFSFNREIVKIFSQSEIRSQGLKTDPRSIL